MDENARIRTRHSLLNRLKSREDQASWQDFYDCYRQLVYNTAVKGGLTHAEAQEVVQETMLAVARNIGHFKAEPSRGSFSAWLMRLTRWRMSDQLRKRRKPGVVPDAVGKPEPNPDETGLTSTTDRIPDPAGSQLEKAWLQDWEKTLTAAALERVKLQIGWKQYQIFDLHVIQNLSVSETTQALRVSAASVYVAKYRISKLLKKEIKELRNRL